MAKRRRTIKQLLKLYSWVEDVSGAYVWDDQKAISGQISVSGLYWHFDPGVHDIGDDDDEPIAASGIGPDSLGKWLFRVHGESL